MANVVDKLKVFDMSTPAKHIKDVDLPGLGVVGDTNSEIDSKELFFMFSSYTDPGSAFRLDMNSLTQEKVLASKFDSTGIKPDDYITDQVWYKSKDGTEIPMFVTRKKSVLPSLSVRPD